MWAHVRTLLIQIVLGKVSTIFSSASDYYCESGFGGSSGSPDPQIYW